MHESLFWHCIKADSPHDASKHANVAALSAPRQIPFTVELSQHTASGNKRWSDVANA